MVQDENQPSGKYIFFAHKQSLKRFNMKLKIGKNRQCWQVFLRASEDFSSASEFSAPVRLIGQHASVEN